MRHGRLIQYALVLWDSRHVPGTLWPYALPSPSSPPPPPRSSTRQLDGFYAQCLRTGFLSASPGYAMDKDESADILGGRIQVSPPRPPMWSDPGRITLLLGFASIAAVAWVYLFPQYRQWKEIRYRKAMRRRHGIPDDDHRPFNVAYAAALQARKKREGRGSGVQQVSQAIPAEDGSHIIPAAVDAAGEFSGLSSPAGIHTGYQNGYLSVGTPRSGANRFGVLSQFFLAICSNDAFSHPQQHPVLAGQGPLSREAVSSFTPSVPDGGAPRPSTGRPHTAARTLHGKHALDDEMDAGSETLTKKSRVEGEELIDGDEEPEWQADADDMDVDHSVQLNKRGSKRMASPEDDEGLALSRTDRRDKRARKVSIDKFADAYDDDMDEDELADDADNALGAARGKKRDRAEAGSTFGGDDYVFDDDEKPQRQRRRRIVSSKLAQSSSRGQKRVRDLESYDSDDSEVGRSKREYTRKKRGKRSDEDTVPVLNDPLCKGRRIGEEWESNGIKFKVGPNGQRLRQELVKKSRSRFPMPSDSQHPDRRANVDVYVETWLTEEEYKAAKERHELAWQDAPPTPPEPQTPGDVPDSPSKAGKNLLWSSTMASRESPAKRGPLRQSIATNVGLRLSVFAAAPMSSTRRISSMYQAPASPASDSPKLHKSKSYSKWEKQDLEAAAMSKIREKQQQQQAKAAPSPAAAQTPAPPSFTAPTSAPTASKPSEKPTQPSLPSFGFPSSASAATNKPATEPPKLNVPGSTPSAATTSNGAAPAASTSQTTAKPGPQTSTSVHNFFAKPAAPAPAASTSVPNFFAKPAEQGAAASTPASTSTTAPSAAASKTPFSFAPAPASTAQPAQPQANGAPATNGAAKVEEAKAVPGSSLLSRIGMGPPPAAQTSSAPSFSFPKPTSTPNAQGQGATTSTPAFGSTAGSTNNAESGPPKFSFGAPSKATSSTPAPAAAPTPASTANSGTTTPKFSFGLNNASSQPAAPTASAPSPFQNSAANATNASNASSAAKSPFSFGSSNAFGGASSTTSASPFGAASGSTAPVNNASPFGAPSNTAVSGNSASPFGAPPKTTASGSNASPFGASSSAAAATNSSAPFGAASGAASTTNNASPFGAASGSSAPTTNASPFGAATNGTNKPAEVPKSAFSFGNNASANNTTSTPADPPKSTFSFGTSAASSSGNSSFFGGNAAQNTTAPKTDAPASKSAFSFASSSTPTFGTISSGPAFGTSSGVFGGSATTPSAGSANESKPFSFAKTTTTAAPSPTPAGAAAGQTDGKAPFSFSFGSSNPSNNSTGSAAPSAPAFGFGAQPSSSNNSTATTTSPFGVPPTQQGSGSFSFGTPSSFSFGSNSGQNTQKGYDETSNARVVIAAQYKPQPPAKTRKSTAMHYSRLAPPPPYAPPMSEGLPDTPISYNALRSAGTAMSPGAAGPECAAPVDEWMDEKSREELSGLLLKADGIIKTRETELSYTSALCKSLYDDNVALKTKHEALLARLPGTGVVSPSASTPASPRLASPNVSRASFAGVMFPGTSDEGLQPLPPAARLRHTRRISVTPAELAHLSDQNAELLDKLERLEAESFKADQAGKRKLRKLEQEIQTLREELDKTQARGAELEEQAKAVVSAVQVQRRKEEVRALKEKSASLSGSDFSGAEVRDFAPPSELPRLDSRKRGYVGLQLSDASDTSGDSCTASFEETSLDAEGVEEDGDAEADSYFPEPPISTHNSARFETEYAIVSQLLSKIRELEETNAQIKEQQRTTEERMRAAQWDVDSIRRVYDCLDVAEVDIEDPEDMEQSTRRTHPVRVPSGSTIRFSSLRRTLIGDMSRLMASGESDDGFAGGILKDMQSTVRDGPSGHKVAPGHKTRKSVVGLFDPEPQVDGAEYPPSLKVSPNFRALGQSKDAADRSTWSIAATDGIVPPSPSLSFLQTPLEGPQTGRTLGSELGSEFGGDDWPEKGFNHHLRASSLYDLTDLNASQSRPGSPVQHHADPPPVAFPSNHHEHADEYVTGPSTPPRAPALHLNIEPPTPTPDKSRSSTATRQYRLSQTVRSRTNRWVEGRFQQESMRDNVSRKRQSTSTLDRRSSTKGKGRAAPSSDATAVLGETFDNALKRVRSRASLASLAFPPTSAAKGSRNQSEAALEDEPNEEADRSVELRRLSQGEAAAVADPAKREGVVGLVLEAWLWLQFIVVVLLFLWAMAKRGPKVVLEAERRGGQRHQ
ncbi:hypothetical protein BV20DRAFT_1114405 [Pilatotrama ljubarskyi]|nr:hypothetical protein BV20DRAFT_1114405 [Pilatotrama ljubarskyi]